MKPILLILLILAMASAGSSCSPVVTTTPILPPEATETQQATETAMAAPLFYPERTDPVGIAVIQSEDTLLAIYYLDGTLLGTRVLLKQERIIDQLHTYGSVSSGAESLGIMHIKWGNKEVIVTANERIILTLAGNLTGYIGVPGQSLIALATAQETESGNLLWQIFLVTPETLPAEEPVFSMEMPYGGAISPLYIDIKNGVPVGIWYTRQPYAIGGEIIFYPTYDLYYLDLTSGESTQYTAVDDIYLPAFSPDGNLLSYVDISSVHVRNMENEEEYSFPILPGSGHGAGEMVISPNNSTIAWKEADGSRLYPNDYTSLLRIAVIAEGLRHDLYWYFFEQSTGYEIGDVEPVTWLDEETLLINIAEENGTRELWSLDVTSLTLRLLARGDFVDFVYP